MRRSLLAPAVLAAALTAALTVAACDGSTSSSSGSTTPSSGPATTTTGSAVSGDAGVAWVDKVCGEVVQLTQAQTTAPPNLANSDAKQALKAFDEYVAKNIDAVDDTIDGIRSAGHSPIAGGDEAVSALVSGLEAVKKGYQTIRDKFSTVNLNDPQAAQAAVIDAFNSLSQGGQELSRALQSIEDNRQLKDAASSAPNCQKLNATMSPTTTTS